MSGTNIVGVQFRRAGKIYNFNSKNFLLSLGDKVVVETDRGPSLAEVMRVGYFDPPPKGKASLKSVLRVASESDLGSSDRLNEDRVKTYATECIETLGLDMSMIGVEVQLGGSKVIIYFTAPGRVDFRELVKDLAAGLKTRVELKQVGARDEAKQVGGIGICGREFCCSSFLREFVPVSIKMAKNQNLALNPSKVSGGCGRLLCCLTYEDETYKALKLKLPSKKAKVTLLDGRSGVVLKGDILNQKVMVEVETGELLNLPLSEVKVQPKKDLEKQAEDTTADDWASDIDVNMLVESSKDKTSGGRSRSERSKRSSNRKSGDQSNNGKQGRQGPKKGGGSRSGNRSGSQNSKDRGQKVEGGQKEPRKRRNRGRRGNKGGNDNNG